MRSLNETTECTCAMSVCFLTHHFLSSSNELHVHIAGKDISLLKLAQVSIRYIDVII